MINFIEVRSPDEISAAASLAYETWNSHYLPIIGQQQIDYMLEKFQSVAAINQQIEENTKYFIAKIENQPVGYFALAPSSDSTSLQVSKLYVIKNQQRSGIGAAIIYYIETYSIMQNVHRLWLTVNRQNLTAIHFYEKMGFNKTGTLIQDIGNGFVMDDYKMIKTIK